MLLTFVPAMRLSLLQAHQPCCCCQASRWVGFQKSDTRFGTPGERQPVALCRDASPAAQLAYDSSHGHWPAGGLSRQGVI